MEPYLTVAQLQPGENLSFWARKTDATDAPYLVVESVRGVDYEVKDLPDYFEYFSYTNLTGQVVKLQTRLSGWDVSFAYRWHPNTVKAEGIQLLELVTDDAALEASNARKSRRPSLHFAPPCQWMNDPNGLCFIDGTYHLFYQFHPNSTDWGPMHWGHATSQDLFNWVHYPIFLHPQQNLLPLGATGGAFSGTACIDSPVGPLFFYTERLPAYDLHKGYTEIQKRVVPNADLTEPVSIRTVLAETPDGVDCDFRDPKVWFDRASNQYLMILGAAIHGDPAVLLYRSQDTLTWTYQGPLYVAPPFFKEQGARCIECPDFFELDGQWVLYMGFVGFQDPDTRRHNLMYYLTGQFSFDSGFVPRGDLREVDFGTDFYAMQSFEANGRRLALAWLYNWEFSKPKGSNYSGEMSIPRQLSLNAQGELCMHPIISGLRSETLPYSPSVPMTWFPGERAFQMRLVANGQPLEVVRIVAYDSQGNQFSVAFKEQQLTLLMPDDTGEIQYLSPTLELHDLTVIYDQGIVEVFANQGAVCGTRRTYFMVDVVRLAVELEQDAGNIEITAETLMPSD